MYDCVCCVCPNFLENTVQGCEHFLSLERTYVPLRHHLAWTSKVLDVNKANYKFLFSVEPRVREEILLANNNITVSCKQICSQALHFYQKLQAKRMKFRPTSFQKPLFLAFKGRFIIYEDDRVGKKIIAFLFLSKARPKGILFFRSPFSI